MNQSKVTGVAPVKEVAVQDQTLHIFPLNFPPQLQGFEPQEQRLTKHPNSLSLRCTLALMLDRPGSPPSPPPTKRFCNFSLCQKSVGTLIFLTRSYRCFPISTMMESSKKSSGVHDPEPQNTERMNAYILIEDANC